MIKVFKSPVTRIFGLVFSVLFSLIITSFAAIKHWFYSPINLKEEKVLVVAPGDTLGKISYQLAKENIILYPRLLIGYAQLTEQTTVEVGEYLLQPGITPLQFLQHLQSGDVVSYNVTLVEGLRFKDFLNNLVAQDKLTITLKDKTFTEIKEQLNLDIEHPEGWFYPDTYRYVRSTSDADILLLAHQRMKKILEQEWSNRSNNLPYRSSYEALIMASIVEKETGVASERTEIAGVFVRRLKKGMRLQTDPTVIYGMGERYKGNIRRKDLTTPTPYNTYVIKGLPPTPIAMPARAAIHAALHPKKGKSLYFVAKGDGSHQFSETLTQHNQAVQKYQIKRRSDYRSSPK